MTNELPTDHELECCSVGDDLASDGLATGIWENRFVAALGRELLAARRKLSEFGMVWDGESWKFNGRDI